jgi:hypothetical protein
MKTAARSPLRPEMAEVPAYATSTASALIRLDRNEPGRDAGAAPRGGARAAVLGEVVEISGPYARGAEEGPGGKGRLRPTA